MIKYILIIAVTFAFGGKYLQAQDCDSSQLMLHQITAAAFKPYYLQYDGTPFFFENWVLGNLTLISGEVHKDLNLKIDLYKDELVYFNSQLKTQLLIDKNIIKSVALNTNYENVSVINYWSNDSTIQSSEFYFILHSDSISLWCKRKKEVNLNTEFTSRYAKLGSFYSKDKYFFMKNGELTRLRLRKRNLIEHFPNVKKEISSIIRKKHYSIKNEQQLTQIFKEINALIYPDIAQ